MNSVYELGLAEKAGSGGRSPPGKTFIVPPEVGEAMAPVLARYRLDMSGFLPALQGGSDQDRVCPWAIVAFEQEYPLAGHVARLRGVKPNMVMSCYSKLAAFAHRERDARTVPPVSILMIRKKGILHRLAPQSPLLQPAWAALKHMSEGRHWFYLSEPPPADWVAEAAVGDEGKYIEAMKSTLRVPGMDPFMARDKPAMLACLVGMELVSRDQDEQALAYLQRAAAGGLGTAEVWHTLGMCRMAEENPEGACEAFHNAVALAPEWPLAWVALAWTLMACGRTEAGRLAYHNALKHDPFWEVAWHELAGVNYYMKDYQGAAAAYSRFLELDPGTAGDWLRMGYSLNRLRRTGEAVLAYERAVELDPSNAMAWNNLGFCKAKLGQVSAALLICRHALELEPASATIWDSLGVALAAADRHGEAIDAFRRALDLDPQLAEARQNLARAYRESGQPEKADKLEVGYALKELERPSGKGGNLNADYSGGRFAPKEGGP